jgi:hypothetical protein
MIKENMGMVSSAVRDAVANQADGIVVLKRRHFEGCLYGKLSKRTSVFQSRMP